MKTVLQEPFLRSDEQSSVAHAGVPQKPLEPELNEVSGLSATRVRNERQALLVAGMHRSGTSALTGVLSLLGAALPTNLLPAMADNPKGFFEPADIVQIHDRLLASAGLCWSDWEQFPAEWYRSAAKADCVAELVAAIHANYQKASLFVIKDPRISRLLPLWQEILSRIPSQPYVIIPYRNPLEVAMSLRARDGIPLSSGLLLWLRHVLDAEFHSRNNARVLLRYENLATNWRTEIDRIVEKGQLSLPRRSARAHNEIDSFIEAKLRRQVASPEELWHRSDVPPLVKAAYEAYESLYESDDEINRRKLDKIRVEFDNASVLFSPSSQYMLGQNASLTKQLERLQHGIQKAEGELASTVAQMQAREADVERLFQQINTAKSEHDATLISFHQREYELAELREKLEKQALGQAALADQHSLALSKFEQRERELAAQLEKQALGQAALADQHSLALSKFEQREREFEQRERELAAQLEKQALGQAALADQHSLALSTFEQRERELRDLISDRELALAESEKNNDWMRRAYITLWTAESRQTRRGLGYLFRRRQNSFELLSSSGLFDTQWYLDQYPEIATKDPLLHYVETGAADGRDPSPFFCTSAYLERYPDVKENGVNPLCHFVLYGAREGRNPAPFSAPASGDGHGA